MRSKVRPFYIELMSVRKDEQLQSIDELSRHTQSIPKACTVGVVIDSTNAYFEESKTKYVKKIKLVDDTYNTGKYNPHLKYSYLTVFFYAPKIEDLPNPRQLGDLLYLRRYSARHPGSRSASTTTASRDTSSRRSTAPGPCSAPTTTPTWRSTRARGWT